MDCRTALEYLDCVRPDSKDIELPEMAPARAHLEQCAACREEFERNQEFDRRVSAVSEEAPVPEWLRASLLSAALLQTAPDTCDTLDEAVDREGARVVAVAGKAEPIRDENAESESNLRNRRPWMRAAVAAAAACCLVVALSVWWQSQPKTWTVAELQQLIPTTPSELDPFDDAFSAGPPVSWDEHRYLRVANRWQGVSLDQQPRHEVAVTLFRFVPPRSAPATGILAAIPADRVSPPPQATSFRQASIEYARKGTAAAVWQEGSVVYVCLLNGNASQLEQIQRSLSGNAA